MNREIKFRAWISKDKQMFNQGDQYLQSFLKRCVRLSSVDAPSEHEKYGNYELMQYTGLKDKNGVECYDGDIISYGYHIELVSWVSNRGAWWPFNSGLPWHIKALYPTDRSKPEFEVIGNIHQNPELLN